jgi:hypothetical protein
MVVLIYLLLVLLLILETLEVFHPFKEFYLFICNIFILSINRIERFLNIKVFVQNVDIDQIPTGLAQDENGDQIHDPVRVFMTYLDQGLNFYSGSQTVNNMPPPATRAPGSTGFILGAANEIFVLQNLLQLIENEIGMALGIPPQREAQFDTNSNASDNRQALLQSYHITEPIMAEIDEVWKCAIEDYVKNFRQYCEIKLERGDNVFFNYVAPDGTEQLFNVTPKMLSHESFGMYMKSNSSRREYNEYMLSMAQAFAQNAGEGVEAVSQIIKAITGGSSPEETHKLIQIRANQITASTRTSRAKTARISNAVTTASARNGRSQASKRIRKKLD